MLDLTTYTPEHRQELEDLLNTPAWRKVIENGLVDRVAKKRIEPGSTRDYIGAAIDQLLSFNEHRVRRRKDIWGENGLVHFASERGAAVNINTNATRLTPEVILHLIAAGIAKLHISLDTPDKATQNTMFGGNRFDRVLEGIYNVQLARDLIGVTYPEIRTNCVLTNKNMETFPDLLSFIFTKRKQLTNRRQPLFNDLFPQTIPVGGDSNADLRPTETEFKKFYEDTWPEVCRRWDAEQDRLGISSENRGALFGYFSNPFLRVAHQGGLEAYVKTAAEGHYGSLALSQYCYVAPTQASFTPDGSQFRCGSHAIRHLFPTGNIRDNDVFDNIRASTHNHDQFPDKEACHGCALATLYINQSIEKKLTEKLDTMLSQKPEPNKVA